jgi:hypothetical protein
MKYVFKNISAFQADTCIAIDTTNINAIFKLSVIIENKIFYAIILPLN